MKETDRLKALEEYKVLDTLPEQEFNHIVDLASAICNTPISLITLLDSKRQWFKAKKGLEIDETKREYAFCHYAIQTPSEVTVVPDAVLDDRFKANPLVTGSPKIRFYAGAPLITKDNYILGTLCVIDNKPRKFSREQKRMLQVLADRVINLLELRKENFIQKIELNSSNSKLSAIMDQTPDFIVTLNKEYKITFVNKLDSSDVPKEKIIGQSGLLFVEPSFHQPYIESVKIVFENGSKREIELKSVGLAGEIRWFNCRFSPLKNDHGEIVEALVIVTDISRIKELQIRDMLNYQRLLEAQATAKIGSWDWDLVTNEIFWSPQMHALFGMDEKDFSAVTFDKWQSMIHPDDLALVKETLTQGIKYSKEGVVDYRIIVGKGEIKWLRAKGVAKNGPDGKANRLFGTSRDITESKLADEREKEYVHALERMLFMVSHEVRKPVTGCLGLIQMMERGNSSEEDMSRQLKYFKGSVEELEIFTRKLTDFIYENKNKLQGKSI